MKRVLCALCIAALAAAVPATAADFSPTLLKLNAESIVQYDFDGSDMELEVSVQGTDANATFCVYTKDKADEIGEVINGYLGWHHVNKVDTCLYFSAPTQMQAGTSTITWDGTDNDGNLIPAGDYTYYIWAFDNVSSKQKMCNFTQARATKWKFQELDENGLPMQNPFYYEPTRRWIVGGDPMDESLMETTTIPVAEGWGVKYQPFTEPTDHDYFYVQVYNSDSEETAFQKYKWVAGGDSELQTDFGNEGYSDMVSARGYGKPGAIGDSDYLYMVDANHYTGEPKSDFYIYDYEGTQIEHIDLTSWWSSNESYEAGAQLNGGPNQVSVRNNMVFLNSHTSCIKQMVDPRRFLDTAESSEFFVWSNRNGDYVLDHNFEDTAERKWVCMDYNVGPYTYNTDADDNLFTVTNAYDAGAVSFGLLAPDGTGIGYFAFAGETAGWKKGVAFIDSGTPFDGLYCDNEQAGGSHYDGWEDQGDETSGTYYVGHDSITGVITNVVGVTEAAPQTFSVEQNVPNPFNPTTTISFSLEAAANVTVDIYNVAGQQVAQLMDGHCGAGRHSVTWDAARFSAGTYFYSVTAGDQSSTHKMTLLK